MRTRYVLAIYEIDLAYGGPEEGGWYYSTGELRRVLCIMTNEEAAYARAARLNGWLDRLQRGQRDVSSVLYNGGRYSVAVYEDNAPPFYPETRPHYE